MLGPSSGKPRQPRPHTPEATPTSSLHRSRRRLLHVGALLLAALVVFVAAESLGYLPPIGVSLDHAFGAFMDAVVHRSPRGDGLDAVSPTVFGSVGFLAFLAMVGVLRSFDRMLRRLRGTALVAAGTPRPLEQFVLDAAAVGIGSRAAREGHHLLEPFYSRPLSIALEDDLRRDVGLGEATIEEIRFALLTRCDRREPTGFGPTTSAAIATVYDLLRHVETAPSQRVDPFCLPTLRAGSATLAAVQAEPPPEPFPAATLFPELRAPTVLEVHTIAVTQESRARLLPHFSEIRRRSGEHRIPTDYAGPYRRATDPRSEQRREQGPGRATPPAPASSSGNPIAPHSMQTRNRVNPARGQIPGQIPGPIPDSF